MTDQERLAAYAENLANQIESALLAWMSQALAGRLEADRFEALHAQIDRAGQQAIADLVGPLRELLAQDIDRQRTTPLAILRRAVPYATRVLSEEGVPEPGRDQDARRLHPHDVYDLTPGSYVEFGPAVQEASLMWGAAKAHIHIQRRKAEEQWS